MLHVVANELLGWMLLFGHQLLNLKFFNFRIQIIHPACIGMILPTTDKEQIDQTHIQTRFAIHFYQTKQVYAQIFM
jgi:hypothetical protein